MGTFVGSGILFGVGDITATLTGLGALTLLQSTEVNYEADEELIKDANGNTKAIAKQNSFCSACLRSK